MYDVGTAQPPGCRATGGLRTAESGGTYTWEDCSSLTAEGGRGARITSVVEGLPRVPAAFVRRELLRHIENARSGALVYAERGGAGTVCSMAVAGHRVLEIRTEVQVRSDGVRQLTRLYFTEPETYPDLLLALHITWKRPVQEDLEQQDRDALEANRRFTHHMNFLAGSD